MSNSFGRIMQAAFNANPWVPKTSEDLTPAQLASIGKIEVRMSEGKYPSRRARIFFTNGKFSDIPVERDAPWQPGDTIDKNNVCFLTLGRPEDADRDYLAPGKAADYTDKINKAQEAEKLRRATMFNQ